MTDINRTLGLTFKGDRANFLVFADRATHVYLGIFSEGKIDPDIQVPLIKEGVFWSVSLEKAPWGKEYAFRCEGPYEEAKGLLYRSEEWLVDPYARFPLSPKRARIAREIAFDWQGDRPPCIPLQDLIIYEMHVRGFTIDPSSCVSQRGTFLGIIEKIPYLKKLGINAVELMPIFGFEEDNYWGYNPIHFFAPMGRYGSPQEFKEMVKALHREGIEILLDVVYNHTAEEDRRDRYYHFRGFSNPSYYMLSEKGGYLDLTGCKNTLNVHHTIVQKLILESLRFWVSEMHVDGFRVDLASILAREPLLMEAIRKDPIFSQTKWIAEPWDAAGTNQLGEFPNLGPWSEWNSSYRDGVRRFLKGSEKASLFANLLCGSDQIYRKSPLSSINFITSHDGYTLRDLVSYEKKHNEENGEGNRDGSDHNESWNCGIEGETSDLAIQTLRMRQMRNFWLALLLSQGIPMLLMGDEYGHTRKGNNNPYKLDTPVNWFLWDEWAKNQKIFRFVAALIAFRKAHPELRRAEFLKSHEIDWRDTNWESHEISFQYGKLFIAFNANSEEKEIKLPPGTWKSIVSTAEDFLFFESKNAPRLSSFFKMIPHSALLALQE